MKVKNRNPKLNEKADNHTQSQGVQINNIVLQKNEDSKKKKIKTEEYLRERNEKTNFI